MIRTFNIWFIIAPLTLLIAILLAVYSVTEDNGKAKKRGSDRFWGIGMLLYAVAAWAIVSRLLIDESLLGMIEYLRDSMEESSLEEIGSYASNVFCALAMLWSVGIYFAFVMVRYHRYGRINRACKRGCSKSDVARRKRAKRSDRKQVKLNRKREKLVKSGKLYIMKPAPASTKSHPAKQPEVVETKSEDTIESRVQELLDDYHIEKRTDINRTCHDETGWHFISKYLPEGTFEYFVAVNHKDANVIPVFLGANAEDAETNLMRYLTELVEEQMTAEAAINQ